MRTLGAYYAGIVAQVRYIRTAVSVRIEDREDIKKNILVVGLFDKALVSGSQKANIDGKSHRDLLLVLHLSIWYNHKGKVPSWSICSTIAGCSWLYYTVGLSVIASSDFPLREYLPPCHRQKDLSSIYVFALDKPSSRVLSAVIVLFLHQECSDSIALLLTSDKSDISAASNSAYHPSRSATTLPLPLTEKGCGYLVDANIIN